MRIQKKQRKMKDEEEKLIAQIFVEQNIASSETNKKERTTEKVNEE